jgi:hypothetical protein
LPCRAVSDLFETTRESSNESSAKRICEGGEWIKGEDGSYYEGERIRSQKFMMRVTEYDSASEAQVNLDTMQSQVGEEDEFGVVRVSNVPWQPSVRIDDFAEAEYRDWVSLDTFKPSIGYQLLARYGSIQFSVSSTDYAAYYSVSADWIVGNARWDDVERIMELLVERYQRDATN